MSRNQSDLVTLSIRLTGVLAMAIAVLCSTIAQAQTSPGVQWVQTSLTDPSFQFYTPTSGALFVRTKVGLMRSDDGGTSWSSVALPPEPPAPGRGDAWPGTIGVDPTNHTTIYASSPNGVYKADDDAETWRVILAPDPAMPEFGPIAVSPADSQLVYATLTHRGRNQIRLVRSADGGTTWETVLNREVSVHVSCDWAIYLLQAHATDPNRLFLATSCTPRAATADVEQSLDRGATWAPTYPSRLAIPGRVVVAGTNPAGQLLIPLAKDYHGGGSLLTRSQDDGATWTTILEFAGGGSMTGGGPSVGIAGLSVDPTAPDRLLLGINASQASNMLDSQIRLSQDGGTTWTEISPPDFPVISDLAFGIDGRMMFAATGTGVWRATTP